MDGLTPDEIKTPASTLELSNIIEYSNKQKLGIIIYGGKTRLNLGNIPSKYNIALNTSKLNRIVDYDPRDLTIVAEAGITMKSLNDILSKDELTSWYYPPNPNLSTLGGTLASNTFDPFRSRFGGLRENIIGATFIRGDGSITKSGGRVVKNVQGFDLHRVHVGALGTLGVLTELALKLAPLPKSFCTMSCEFDDFQDFNYTYQKIVETNISPDILSLHFGKGSELLHYPHFFLIEKLERNYGLVCVISGTRASVEKRKDKLGKIVQSSKSKNINFEEIFFPKSQETSSPTQEILIRTSMTITEAIATLPQLNQMNNDLLRISTVFHFHFGTLFVEVKCNNDKKYEDNTMKNTIQDIINLLKSHNSNPIIENCGLSLKQEFDVFGTTKSDFFIMKQLKNLFDPNRVLNPGRFIGKL